MTGFSNMVPTPGLELGTY